MPRVARKAGTGPWPLPSEQRWQCLGCSETCNGQRDGALSTRVQCTHCDRQWHTACLDLEGAQTHTGIWYCDKCSQAYWQGFEDGRGEAATPSVVARPVNTAAPRSVTLFCCTQDGCKQAAKEHNFGSGYHLKVHMENAHGPPRFGPCTRCNTMFKSRNGFRQHEEKALNCASLVPATVPVSATVLASPVPAVATSAAPMEPTPTAVVQHAATLA